MPFRSPRRYGDSRWWTEHVGAARVDLLDRRDGAVLHTDLRLALWPKLPATTRLMSRQRAVRRVVYWRASRAVRVPAIRQRIETSWGAQVTDHSGATEVGPWGYADRGRPRPVCQRK